MARKRTEKEREGKGREGKGEKGKEKVVLLSVHFYHQLEVQTVLYFCQLLILLDFFPHVVSLK